jgi:hypothetical protein
MIYYNMLGHFIIKKQPETDNIFADICNQPITGKIFTFCLLLTLIGQPINLLAFGVDDGHCYGYTAIQAVGCAGHSGVVGTDGHLHPVEQPLIVVAILNE